MYFISRLPQITRRIKNKIYRNNPELKCRKNVVYVKKELRIVNGIKWTLILYKNCLILQKCQHGIYSYNKEGKNRSEEKKNYMLFKPIYIIQKYLIQKKQYEVNFPMGNILFCSLHTIE